MNAIKKTSREHNIPLRLNDEERAKLETIAAMWGLSLSAALRRLIREKRVMSKRGEAEAAKADEALISQG